LGLEELIKDLLNVHVFNSKLGLIVNENEIITTRSRRTVFEWQVPGWNQSC